MSDDSNIGIQAAGFIIIALLLGVTTYGICFCCIHCWTSTCCSRYCVRRIIKYRLNKIIKLIKFDKIEQGDLCSICLDHFNKNRKIGALACGHYYHYRCIKKWLIIKRVCPLCISKV